MLVKVLAGGGLASAVAAATCCVLPLSLGALGIGSASLSALSFFAPYQTAFRVAAILMLGAAFWLIYRRPAVTAGGACAVDRSQAPAKAVAWFGVAILGLVVTSGWWGQFVGPV